MDVSVQLNAPVALPWGERTSCADWVAYWEGYDGRSERCGENGTLPAAVNQTTMRQFSDTVRDALTMMMMIMKKRRAKAKCWMIMTINNKTPVFLISLKP